MYIDLHGHSRKYNVFMYGCDDKKKAKPLVRAFPKFFSSHSVGGKYVSYGDCSFHVRKGRESTARVVVSRELNIPLSFTLEATFCGSNYGPYQVYFTPSLHCLFSLPIFSTYFFYLFSPSFVTFCERFFFSFSSSIVSFILILNFATHAIISFYYCAYTVLQFLFLIFYLISTFCL